jgi:signal transduction histidine kinase
MMHMDEPEDMGTDSLEKIKSRVEYLERTNSWYFIALEGLASLWDLDKDVKLYRDPKFLFENARKHLQQFMKFRTMAFYLVEEPNNQFLLEGCFPESERQLVEKEVLYQIEQGNFAWALRQSRPLVVPDQSSDNELILHRVATKSRVAGMFVGRFEGHVHKVPIEQLNLISIILSNTAYAIENGSLFKHVQNQNLNLEHTVKERTQTLENKARQLKKEIEEREQIEEELKRSNQDLQDFASIASHDLQEPLRKVIMFGDRLKKQFSEAMNEKALGFLERMGNAAERMQVLIDELLLYSRVGTKAEPFKDTNLDTVIREVLSDLESRITRSGAKIELENLPTVEADGMQMRQLFQNLISNALKFHKKDVPPEVVIRGRMNGSSACEVLVKDNGVGFDEKYIQRIFKPFERLHGRSDYEGTGMGLAICQKIVKRHGGSIHVESKLNEGCTFTITLPVKQPQTEQKDVG